MNKKNKIFIFTTLTLIFIFSILAISGNVLDKKIILYSKNQKAEIPKNVLTFKDNFNKIIGQYKCNYENCNFAYTTIDDNKYYLEYLISENHIFDEVINDRFVFIEDYNNENNRKTIIYDILNRKKFMEVDYIKNYNINLENNYFIYCINDKFGILSLNDNGKILFSPIFDYIGVNNQVDVNSNKLLADKFVAKQDNKWMIIDLSGNALSILFDYPIANYNGLYITTYENGKYKLYDYDGNEYLKNNSLDYISFTAKFVNVVENKKLKVIDPKTNLILTSNILLEKDNYKYENSFIARLENNKYNITVLSDRGIINKFTLDT